MWVPFAAAAASALLSHGLNKLDKSGAPGAGTQDRFQRIRTGTPEASKFQKYLFRTGGGLGKQPTYKAGRNYLMDLLSGEPEAFANFEAPYMQNFEEQILPSIANRFAGMGTGASGLSSSGFQQTLAQAGRGLQKDLAAMRSGLQMQAIPQAYQFAQGPLQNQLQAMNWSPYQTTFQQGQPGMYDALGQVLPGALQSSLTNYFTQPNPPGATAQPGGIGSGGSYNPALFQ